jgi:hypothetical protein
MAGLPWVRLDTTTPWNPKILRLLRMRDGHRAVAVYLLSLAFSGAQGSAGVLGADSLSFFHARPGDAARLVEVGLWHEYPDGGWLIHDWDEMQVSQQRSEMARKAAEIRWGKGKS